MDKDLRELVEESIFLLDIFVNWKTKFHDYAFIVFPAAKAYEGYLKKVFLDLGFISMEEYKGQRFRVGKALNPQLERKFRQKESIYDKLVLFCGGSELADSLWNTWKQCRNLIFHWFPKEKRALSYDEARSRVVMIIDSMDLVFKECKINLEDKTINAR